MRILAIDTSSSSVGVALVDGQGVAGEANLATGRQHSEVLLPLTEGLLRAAGLELAALNVIAVTIGPGSFTGLRIGLATAKAWAQVTGKPLVAVSTLEALATTAMERRQLICPVLDARRGELYAALFEGNRRLWPDMAIAPAELAVKLAKYQRPIIFCGDGLRSEGAALQQVLGENMRLAPPQRRLFMAAAAGIIAREKCQTGDFADPVTLEPAYLRLSEAEEKRRAQNGGQDNV